MMDRPVDFKSFVQAAGDALIAADKHGVISLWNPAAERIFGFSADEALGKTLDLIIPERFRRRHWKGYQQVMSSGTTVYAQRVLRVPALHKEGHVISVSFTVTLLFSSRREVGSIVAVIRDDTASWNQTQTLRQELAECEKRLTDALEKGTIVP